MSKAVVVTKQVPRWQLRPSKLRQPRRTPTNSTHLPTSDLQFTLTSPRVPFGREGFFNAGLFDAEPTDRISHVTELAHAGR